MIFRYFDVLSITSYIRKKCDFDHFCEGADLQLYFKKKIELINDITNI